ncbi:DUF1289 domain-containing protein [Zoogloea sp.]|uniref:DUF1289 domain-containing protein n=1 Tax=Zoogloea sp. TaxID=49181 RepID=UPI002602223B|nr:DUF1289 domain-containing protein [uncultured Zoogloea sp.]
MSQDNPCIGICEIDESGYCIGCGRSADEIFGETDSPAADQEVATEVLTPVAGSPGDASG